MYSRCALGLRIADIADSPVNIAHIPRPREFCTTSQHVLEMCLSVLEVCNYPFSTARMSSSSPFEWLQNLSALDHPVQSFEMVYDSLWGL